eukprot:scaffold200560_cov20-Tisochrysis_lutea.AAC.1
MPSRLNSLCALRVANNARDRSLGIRLGREDEASHEPPEFQPCCYHINHPDGAVIDALGKVFIFSFVTNREFLEKGTLQSQFRITAVLMGVKELLEPVKDCSPDSVSAFTASLGQALGKVLDAASLRCSIAGSKTDAAGRSGSSSRRRDLLVWRSLQQQKQTLCLPPKRAKAFHVQHNVASSNGSTAPLYMYHRTHGVRQETTSFFWLTVQDADEGGQLCSQQDRAITLSAELGVGMDDTQAGGGVDGSVSRMGSNIKNAFGGGSGVCIGQVCLSVYIHYL